VVVDPASNWPLFAEKARDLIEKEKVDVVFGCWTSVSRKSVLPVFEELNGLLFYPVQYEGEESSKNVFYTGTARATGASRTSCSTCSRCWARCCPGAAAICPAASSSSLPSAGRWSSTPTS